MWSAGQRIEIAEHDRQLAGCLGLIEQGQEGVLAVDRGDVGDAEVRELLLVVEDADVLDRGCHGHEVALAHDRPVVVEAVHHERGLGELVEPAERLGVLVEIEDEPGLPQGAVDHPALVALHDVGRIVTRHRELDGLPRRCPVLGVDVDRDVRIGCLERLGLLLELLEDDLTGLGEANLQGDVAGIGT